MIEEFNHHNKRRNQNNIGNSIKWMPKQIKVLAFVGHGASSPHIEFDHINVYIPRNNAPPDLHFIYDYKEIKRLENMDKNKKINQMAMYGYGGQFTAESEKELLRLKPLFNKDAVLILSACQVAAGEDGMNMIKKLSNLLNIRVMGSSFNQCGTYKLRGDVIWCDPNGKCVPNHPIKVNDESTTLCFEDENPIKPQCPTDKKMCEFQKEYKQDKRDEVE